MSARSKIEWTADPATGTPGSTWNPVRGCSRVSAGCKNCYAERMAARFSKCQCEMSPANPIEGTPQPFHGFAVMTPSGPRWTGRVELDEAKLELPLHWRKPRRIFVNSMSDLFHEALPDAAIDRVFAVMALCPQHTFMVLTKRAERMAEYMGSRSKSVAYWEAAARGMGHTFKFQDPISGRDIPLLAFPPSNVDLGVSCEDQPTADERIAHLMRTPAAVRFVSLEPLLGAVDLRRWLASAEVACKACEKAFWLHDADPCGHATSGSWTLACPNCGHCRCRPGNWVPGPSERGDPPPPMDFPGDFVEKRIGRFTHIDPRFNVRSLLDWIIVGGESGPGARPMHPDWARSIRDQCVSAEIPLFMKQWGEWCHWDQLPDDTAREIDAAEGQPYSGPRRVGKRAAGALLDGREWRQFPGEGA